MRQAKHRKQWTPWKNPLCINIDLYNTYTEENILQRSRIKSPVVRETELVTSLPKKIIKQKLLYKLSAPGIQALNREMRFLELSETVNNLS